MPCIALKAEFLAVIQAVHSRHITAVAAIFSKNSPGRNGWLCQESHTFNVSPVSP